MTFERPVSGWTLAQIDQVLAARARWSRHWRDSVWWARMNELLDRRLELTGGLR